MRSNDLQTEIKDWRWMFSPDMLDLAQTLVDGDCVKEPNFNESYANALIGNGKKMHFRVSAFAPVSFSDDWDPDKLSCNCNVARRTRYRWMSSVDYTCVHEAALLLLWEEEHGPWVFTETEAEHNARINKERIVNAREKLAKKKELDEQKKTFGSEWTLPEAVAEGAVFFDIPAALRHMDTNEYAIERGRDLYEKGEVKFSSEPVITFDEYGKRLLKTSIRVSDELETETASINISGYTIRMHSCTCSSNSYYFYRNDLKHELCAHELAALSFLYKYIQENDPGDSTDRAAERLFAALDGGGVLLMDDEDEAPAKEKKKNVTLIPRIIMEDESASLSFKISKDGGKPMILKGFRNLEEAIDKEETFKLGKNLIIDFAKDTFTDESQEWLSLILERIGDADRASDKLAGSRYGYYYSKVSVKNNEELNGSNLDHFYEIAEGSVCDFEDKNTGEKGTIRIGQTDVKIVLRAESRSDSKGRILGVDVSGEMPRILDGRKDKYVLSKKGLGLISEKEKAALLPFERISDAGKICFSVGKSRLSEFYYRVVPGLIENPYISFYDEAETAIENILPPEPEFLFRFDIEGDQCVLTAKVTYDDKSYRLPFRKAQAGEYHDVTQEERVQRLIRKYFPETDSARQAFYSLAGDDAIFSIQTDGVSEFSALGEVQATDAFDSRKIRRAPSFNVSVSIDGGLLDIQVLSKDASVGELSDLYNSYRMKKRYHRLSDGSFVDLTDTDIFGSLEDVADGLDLSASQILSGKVELPVYRALYLDKLLEDHEELVANRDKTYRSLVKNFKTIRDTDFEVPEEIEDVLRPYQTYGHKWMRTVLGAGFGGILADEMGLGKTLETISVMKALKNEGEKKPMLVVCPASLVFNWEEEIHRFAPGLSVSPISGIASGRKKQLSLIGSEEAGDVYVTSYDTLRADIGIYKGKEFSLMVIDEAQYIKNTKAAMTKAVKVIKADRHMALTGTPIENRLSELWSIFDFLMPGFLFDQTSFSEKFDVPITKNKDEAATNRLKNMTGPFILRRKKTDVLKDLPPKLEEVRYARFDEDQRKLYDAQVLHMKGLLEEGASGGEGRIQIFAELTRIRQICCDPSLIFEDYVGGSAKRQAAIELIQNAIGGGHRMLVFSQFTSMLSLLEEDLKSEKIPYYVITGATPKEQRIRLVREFNEGDVPVFLISLKAGGTGLNLTGADMVIHYDPWWNLAAQNQATDRAHRIGQEKTVTVYKLIVKDTIEEKIMELQNAKKDLAEAILSGERESLFTLSEEELLGLFE